jgi:hypothetical protein
MQLDIFEHSRDTMLSNDVLHALERRDVAEATAARQRFTDEYPLDQSLGPLAVLIAALAQRTPDPFPDHDAVRDARRMLTDEVEPAALRLFGEKAAAAWLVPLWRETAQRAAPLAFVAARYEDHAAPLCLRAGDWAQAAAAVEGIESWRRIPAPLAWMAEARCRLGAASARDQGLEANWGLLAELAWLSPARFDALTQALADPAIDRLRKKFGANFEGNIESKDDTDDLAWFPAWALTEEPSLAHWLGQAQPGLQTEPERAMRLMLDLLTLERQGRHRDMVAKRKLLRDAHPSLYAAYMKTR